MSVLAPGTADKTVRMIFPDTEDWEPEGRPDLEPHQIPPKDFVAGSGNNLWLLEAGRGAGKTEACSRYFTKWMRRHPGHRGRIIAPTYGDAVESCVDGPSGLKSVDPEVRFVPSAPGGSKVIWPNGSEALLLGTHSPRDVERLRAGGNRNIDWWEEMAANPQLGKAWDQAAFGLRLGEWPHAIASSTPRNTSEYKAIRKMDGVVFTRASMFANPHNPKWWVDMMRKKYEGTRLGRQELAGELLEDVEGALWSRKMIELSRVEEIEMPDLAVVVTAVDPAATSSPDADDTGIVVGGLGVDAQGYCLADRTCHLNPDGWGQRVVRTHYKYKGDYVVAEVNNGGEMVEHVIATVDRRVPYRAVHASRGKQTRAQPVAALFGDGKKRLPQIHMVGSHPELEDQLCTWVPGEEKSPDRLDAFVWAFTELMLAPDGEEEIVEHYEPVRIGADI